MASRHTPKLTGIAFILLSLLGFSNNTEEFDNSFLDKYDNRSFAFSENPVLNEISIETNSTESIVSDDYPTFSDPVGGGEIESKFKSIMDSLTLFDKISLKELSNVTLPAGMTKTISGKIITVAVVRAYFSVDYVMMDMLVKITWEDEKDSIVDLMFGAWNIKAYYDKGWPEELSLVLLKDVGIPLGDKVTLQLNGDFGIATSGTVNKDLATSISLNCGDINSLHVYAVGKVIVNDSLSIKKVIKKDEKFIVEDSVFFVDFKTDFYLFTGDFYIELLEKEAYFTYKETDFIFGLSNFTIDLSTKQSNPYFLQSQSTHLWATDKNLIWRGLYVQNFDLFLPVSYTCNDGSGDKRISINAHDLIIDEFGISTSLEVSNLTNLYNNTAFAKMPFLLNEVGISITQNEVSGILIGGELSPSLLKEGEMVGFTASWETNDIISVYALTVEYAVDTVKMDGGKEVAAFPAKLKSIKGTITVATDSSNVITEASLEVSCFIVVTIRNIEIKTGCLSQI